MNTAWLLVCITAIALAPGTTMALAPDTSEPSFTDFKPDVQRFAWAVEAHCKFAPGTALSVRNNHQLMVKLTEPQSVSWAQFMCLMAPLQDKAAKESGLQILLVGESRP
jgi:hypothetical protein